MAAGFSQFPTRVLQLCLLITVYFSFVICDKFHPPATKHDIDYLQSQIDAKTNQIETIQFRLKNLEALTSSYTQQQQDQDRLISGLMNNMSIAQNDINQLQNTNDYKFEQRVRGLEKRVGVTENEMIAVQLEMADLTRSYSSSMTKINQTLVHLYDVNQIWKGNFRNINITFHNLKKKVNFNIPSFRW